MSTEMMLDVFMSVIFDSILLMHCVYDWARLMLCGQRGLIMTLSEMVKDLAQYDAWIDMISSKIISLAIDTSCLLYFYHPTQI